MSFEKKVLWNDQSRWCYFCVDTGDRRCLMKHTVIELSFTSECCSKNHYFLMKHCSNKQLKVTVLSFLSPTMLVIATRSDNVKVTMLNCETLVVWVKQRLSETTNVNAVTFVCVRITASMQATVGAWLNILTLIRTNMLLVFVLCCKTYIKSVRFLWLGIFGNWASLVFSTWKISDIFIFPYFSEQSSSWNWREIFLYRSSPLGFLGTNTHFRFHQ